MYAPQPRALVLMPPQAGMEPLRDMVREVLRKAEVEPLDAGDRHSHSAVDQNAVFDGIRKADFIVADISIDPEWTLYQLGIAYGVGKPAILLMNEREERALPIDIASYSVVFYDPDDPQSLRPRLLKLARIFMDQAVAS